MAFFARLSVFLYIRVQSFDYCFQVEKVYISRGLLWGLFWRSFQGLSVLGLLGSASVDSKMTF